MSTASQPNEGDREREADLQRATVVGRLEEVRKERNFLQGRVSELDIQEQKYIQDLDLLNDNEQIMSIKIPLRKTAKEIYEKTIMFPISIGMCLVATGSILQSNQEGIYSLVLGSFAATLSLFASALGLRSYLSSKPEKG